MTNGQFVHLNGRLVPAAQATISVFDGGFLHGTSVFTTMLGHNGRVFRLDRHLHRLLTMAGRIGLRTTATAESLTAATNELLAANKLSRARLRITLSPGAPDLEGEPTTLVSAASLEPYPKRWYDKGLSVVISRTRQYEGDIIAGLKTGCYLSRVLVRQQAALAGADEAIWFTVAWALAEACFSNVFLVKAGKVLTPPLNTPILPGVVRDATLELCEQAAIPFQDDKPLTIDDLLGADEIFLTSSTMAVRPVVIVEKKSVADELPGPITRQLMAGYADLLDQECPAK